MHYNPNVLEAFDSVEHIMRDVNNGWLLRYLHSNTASAFFFLVYLHIGRNLYYGSYRAPRTLVFTIGVIIFLLMIGTAFLGYTYGLTWSKLDLYSIISIDLHNIIINFFLLTFIINFILFYLNDFSLSSNNFIKYLQIICFILLPLFALIVLNVTNITDFICYVNDKDNQGLHGEYNISKESAESIGKGMCAIGKGMSTLGS